METCEPRHKKWMNVRETAAYLGLTERSLYNRVHMGRVPHCKLGSSLRFDRDELDAFMRKNSFSPDER